MEKKIQQHYVWEFYLKAWCFNDKQVFCHRVQDKKTFPVNPEKTAKEREFYRLKEFTENDESVIYGAFIKGTYNEAVNMGWVREFKKVFDMINDLKSKGIYNEEIEKEFEILIVNAEEELHTNIEKNALPILESLKKMDISPFYNEDTRIDFSIFLCTQYYRTKKLKNSVIRNTKDIAKKMDADIERMWNVISHILATNLSHSLIMKKDSKWTLLTNSKSTFITSDQPIVNIKGKYSNDEETEELELYYPISPSKALLISDINNSPKPDIFEINEEEIKKYNSIILNTCEEQIYLNNIDILKDLM